MQTGGKIYIGLSGLETELAQGTEQHRLDVSDRHSYLDPEIQERFSIKEKITLYDRKDAVMLVEQAGFRVHEIQQSTFGNWKIIGQKCDTITL
jgi:hypothetical protein